MEILGCLRSDRVVPRGGRAVRLLSSHSQEGSRGPRRRPARAGPPGPADRRLHPEPLEKWVQDSRGKIRGDKAHERLAALGDTGTERTTRRALSEIKVQWRLGNTRVHRPWVTEPGLWLQYDFGDGPIVGGRKVVLLVGLVGVVPLSDRHRPARSDRS